MQEEETQTNFRAGLVALLTVPAARASLPASVSSNVYVPGDHVSSVRIPVLSDGAAGPGFIDPTTPSVQPLLITAVDADDLFFGFATADDESLDDFLLLGPDGNSHFLFSSWSEDSSNILRLRARINARLKALSVKVAAQWTGRLHFTNGTAKVLGKEIVGAMKQWGSPRNMITVGSLNISRIDCHYTFVLGHQRGKGLP